MGKRAVITIIAVLTAGMAITGFLLHMGREASVTDPYKVVSTGACIVVETADFRSFLNSLTTGKGLFGEASRIEEWQKFSLKLKYLTDQINKPEITSILSENAAVISFHATEKGRMKTLLSVNIPARMKLRKFKETLYSAGARQISEIRVNGKPMLQIPYTVQNSADTVFISVLPGLLLCSNSSRHLAEAMDQSGKNTDVRDNKGFSRVFLASGSNEDKVFVVFANLREMIWSFLGSDAAIWADKISKLAGTTGGDIYIDESGLVLSGYTEIDDTTGFLYHYKDLPAKAFHTYKILPSATIMFATMMLPDERKIPAGPDNSLSDFRRLIGEEATKAVLDVNNRSGDVFISELTNSVRAEHLFQEVAEPFEVTFFSTDDQVRIPVYKSSSSFIKEIPEFTVSSDSGNLFFAFYDKYIVASASYETVSAFLYDNILNRTLANDPVYHEFETTLPSTGGYLFYCVPARMVDLLDRYINPELSAALKKHRLSLNKVSSAGWSFSSSNGMLYNSLSVRFKEKAREESVTEWETLLDTVASIKPFFFTNHITGEKEIFVQDLRNNIYLINTAGRVLWKVPLNEKISGTVYSIDYYRNGKNQLLFSGREFLHIIDRNGNYLEKYPVRFRSPATNPVSLFDYDNNGEYRIFAAGEDRVIYSYEKSGILVKGWKQFRTAGTVTGEINHFRISGKDYIVVADDASVYFLDRTGNKRLSLREPVEKAPLSPLRLYPGSKPSVVCTAADGTVQHIYFDGSIRKMNLRKFTPAHRFDVFDVDGDGLPEYIFTEGDMLFLYDDDYTPVFSRKFESASLSDPMDFIFSASVRKIGLYDISNKLIYLIDKSGETMKGFPLSGASMFSIGKLLDRIDWNLIVGGPDRFLYNYKINNDLISR